MIAGHVGNQSEPSTLGVTIVRALSLSLSLSLSGIDPESQVSLSQSVRLCIGVA